MGPRHAQHKRHEPTQPRPTQSATVSKAASAEAPSLSPLLVVLVRQVDIGKTRLELVGQILEAEPAHDLWQGRGTPTDRQDGHGSRGVARVASPPPTWTTGSGTLSPTIWIWWRLAYCKIFA
jgi:hypothetical protein